MNHLQKPKMDVEQIVEDCASSFRESTRDGLKKKLIDLKTYIKSASDSYDVEAEHGNWDVFKQHTMVNELISTEDMCAVYTEKFVKSDNKDKYYNRILKLAETGKCPICGIGQVSTLDHYLAKTLYPTYAITPYNLVPVCRDCNFEKRDTGLDPACAPLHPYYDDIDSHIWLIALLVFKENKIVVQYDVNPEIESYDPELFVRIKAHMNLFKLNKAYAVQASTEIAEYMEVWKQMSQKWRKEDFIKYLTTTLKSKETTMRNTWHTALLRALIENVDLIK